MIGKVVAGRIVVEGAPLPDGSTVTILPREDDETFTLSPEQEALLLASIEEADGGETVDAQEVLQKLRRRT